MNRFSLPARNVRFILIGLIVMIAGYVLMIGPAPSPDPDVFNASMFDFRRLVVSPLLVIAGIVVIIVAIMKTPRDAENREDEGR